MPRLMRRAAVLGATAHVASQRGQAKGAATAQESAAQVPAASAAQAPEPVTATSGADGYDELMKAKELLDAGVLTQAEFDVEKQKILGA